MLQNYFKTAFRNLWKNKTYSFLNIFGLATGITCAGFIFLWVENERSYNRFNKKYENIYQVLEHQSYEGKNYTFSATPGLLGPTMKNELPGVKTTARSTWQQTVLFSLGDKSIYERGYFADSSLLDIFTLPLVQGSRETVFSQLHSLVITEKMAGKFFPADKNIIGKTLRVDNRENYVISGVIKDLPANSTFQFEWIAPFKIYFDKNEWLLSWGNNGIQTFVELDERTKVDPFNKKFAGYIQSKDTSAIARPFLFAMKDWRLRSKFEDGKQTGGRIQYVRMFTTIAWIILLIACINFMNLATARSEKRAREVGVRKVLGAGKKTLVGQFLGEAMFMAFIAVLLAVAIMLLLLPAFNLLVEKKLSLGLNDPLHVLALLAIGLTCGLVAGSYPALYLSSFNPIWVFKGMKMKGSSAAYVRKGLVVLQFTISIMLIIATIIIYQQVQHVKNRELGFDKDSLLELNLQGDMQKNFSVIKQELLSTGQVENAAMGNSNMLEMGNSTMDFTWEGKDISKKILVTLGYVSPEYIKTTGMNIKKGRDFYPIAANDSSAVIVNETLAKLIGKEDPTGMALMRDSTRYTIAGVVKDFVFGDMYAKNDPLVFMVWPQFYNYLYVKVKPQANIEKAVARIEGIIKRNNPAFPVEYDFVDENFNNIFKSEMLIGKLSRIFAILAIIISCLGLFGLAAFTAEQRTKEIGIRKVLGASVRGITGLLSKDFLLLVLISAIIAFPLAWWTMHNWLQDFAYRIHISWWVFMAAGIAALFIALFTISFQSIKAALANPVRALRSE